MKKQPDNPLTVEFKSQGIPIIDEEKPEETLKALGEVFAGWDAIGKARAEEALSTMKVILAVLVPDWINPYAREGKKIPVVIFSTHPEYKVGERLDKGFQIASKTQGYRVLLLAK